MAHDRDSPAPSDQSGYETELFRTVMFGYERSQVDDYVDALRDEVRVLSDGIQRLLPLEGTLAAEHAETLRLRSDLAAQSLGATTSTRIHQMLRLAEDEATALRRAAEDLLAEAGADAEQIRREARMDAELAAAAHRRENQAEAAALLAKARAEADRILAEARGRSRPAEPRKVNGEPRQDRRYAHRRAGGRQQRPQPGGGPADEDTGHEHVAECPRGKSGGAERNAANDLIERTGRPDPRDRAGRGFTVTATGTAR